MNHRYRTLILVLFACSWIGVFALDNVSAQQQKSDQVAKTNDDKTAKDDTNEYYEQLRLFIDTLDQIDRNYVNDISRRELMEAAIRGMLQKLDQYSNYIPPSDMERFRGSVESEFGGIGIQVTAENGILRVISPIVGSPAYRQGLIAGDHITQIEGKPTKGITIDEAVRQMKGKVGTAVTITVVHPNDPMPKEIKIKRAIIRVDSVLGDLRKEDDAWNFFYDEEKKLGYVRITSFTRRTVDELRVAMKELLAKNVKGLVLDLRFNPGGLLSTAIEVCDMFIEEGRIVSTEGRNAPKRTWDAHKKGTFPDFPMAILVNRYSASASEIVSACLQDHGRAVVIGERTWGKGSVQNIIDLEHGRSALKLTTASYKRPSGKNIHRFKGAKDSDDWGVLPSDGYKVRLTSKEMRDLSDYRRERDIVRERKDDESESDFEDIQLAKALEYLQQELNPNEATAKNDRPQENKPQEKKKTDDKPNDSK